MPSCFDCTNLVTEAKSKYTRNANTIKDNNCFYHTLTFAAWL